MTGAKYPPNHGWVTRIDASLAGLCTLGLTTNNIFKRRAQPGIQISSTQRTATAHQQEPSRANATQAHPLNGLCTKGTHRQTTQRNATQCDTTQQHSRQQTPARRNTIHNLTRLLDAQKRPRQPEHNVTAIVSQTFGEHKISSMSNIAASGSPP